MLTGMSWIAALLLLLFGSNQVLRCVAFGSAANESARRFEKSYKLWGISLASSVRSCAMHIMCVSVWKWIHVCVNAITGALVNGKPIHLLNTGERVYDEPSSTEFRIS